MFGKIVDQLEEVGDLLPMYTPSRCLSVRQVVGGCDLCQTACPHGAIELRSAADGFGIDLKEDPCTGCGICAQVCPTGALEWDEWQTLQAILKAKQSGPVVVSCSQSRGGISVPCLGKLSISQMLAAGELTVLHGDCSTCSMGDASVPTRVTALAKEANHYAVVTVVIQEGQQDEAVLSRRQAWKQFFYLGKRQLAKQIPDQPFLSKEEVHHVPREWHWRKKFIRVKGPVFWPAPIVNDRCNDCPVCSNVCPTKAITRLWTPDQIQLMLHLDACTGCMACMRSCPMDAMNRQEWWNPQAFQNPLILRDTDEK